MKEAGARDLGGFYRGDIGNCSMMTRGGGFGASSLRLPPPARHHLGCPGSIASRCFDDIASRSSIASLRDARDASIAPRSSKHRYTMLRSLRDLRSHILEGSKSNRYFACFCAARCSMPQKVSEIPTLLGPLRAGALQVPSKSRANRTVRSLFTKF